MIPDWRQFRALLGAQLKVDFRRPRTGGGAVRQRELSALSRTLLSGLVYVFISVTIGALAPHAADLRTYAALVLGFSLTMLGMLMLTEFTVTVMQGEDLIVLGPRPVSDATYTWATLASLGLFVGFYAVVASVFPVLMAFWAPGGGIRLAACLALLILLGLLAWSGVVLALYGAVLRRMRLEKARDLLNWITIAFTALVPVGFLMTRGWMERTGLSVSLNLGAHPWMAWLPPVWMAGLADFLLGARDDLTRALALRAASALAVGLACGVWALSTGVLKLTDRVKGAEGEAPLPGAVVRPSRPDGLAWMRPFLPSPASWGVFRLLLAYLARDRGTKARIYPQFGASLAFLAIYAFRKGGDPWAGEDPGSWAYVAAYYPAMTCAWIPLLLRFSEQWEAGWTFAVAPGASLADLALALKRASALLLLAPAFLLTWLFFAWRWASPAHALLHVAPPFLGTLALMDVAILWRKPIPFACRYMKGDAGTRMAVTFTVMGAFTGLGFLQGLWVTTPARAACLIAGLGIAAVATERVLAGRLSGRGIVLADL